MWTGRGLDPRARPPTARGASSSANGSSTSALTGRATEIVRAGWTGAVDMRSFKIYFPSED